MSLKLLLFAEGIDAKSYRCSLASDSSNYWSSIPSTVKYAAFCIVDIYHVHQKTEFKSVILSATTMYVQGTTKPILPWPSLLHPVINGDNVGSPH